MSPLSKRLRCVLKYLKDTRTLYDVGTDHAYLPIAAVREMDVKRAIAIDNKPGPLAFAKKNVKEAGLENTITLKRAEGLDALTEDVDTVTIAGLGGHKIQTVVRKAELKRVRRLVLQPNDHAKAVRELCDTRSLAITDETCVIERGKLYVVIVMERGSMALTERERAFGPVLLRKREPRYMNHLKTLCERLRDTLSDIPEKDRATLKRKIALLEAILNERK